MHEDSRSLTSRLFLPPPSVRPCELRLAGNAPSPVAAIPVRPRRGGELHLCPGREGAEGDGANAGLGPSLRQTVRTRVEPQGGEGGGGTAARGESFMALLSSRTDLLNGESRNHFLTQCTDTQQSPMMTLSTSSEGRERTSEDRLIRPCFKSGRGLRGWVNVLAS